MSEWVSVYVCVNKNQISDGCWMTRTSSDFFHYYFLLNYARCYCCSITHKNKSKENIRNETKPEKKNVYCRDITCSEWEIQRAIDSKLWYCQYIFVALVSLLNVHIISRSVHQSIFEMLLIYTTQFFIWCNLQDLFTFVSAIFFASNFRISSMCDNRWWQKVIKFHVYSVQNG